MSTCDAGQGWHIAAGHREQCGAEALFDGALLPFLKGTDCSVTVRSCPSAADATRLQAAFTTKKPLLTARTLRFTTSSIRLYPNPRGLISRQRKRPSSGNNEASILACIFPPACCRALGHGQGTGEPLCGGSTAQPQRSVSAVLCRTEPLCSAPISTGQPATLLFFVPPLWLPLQRVPIDQLETDPLIFRALTETAPFRCGDSILYSCRRRTERAVLRLFANPLPAASGCPRSDLPPILPSPFRQSILCLLCLLSSNLSGDAPAPVPFFSIPQHTSSLDSHLALF